MFQKNAKPNLFEKLIYGSGQIGLNALYTLFSSYVLLFYTDVIGINAATIGMVILLSKLFDGVSDLIAGHYIDTHKSKYGHCIPVILRWTIPMIASVVAVFLVPRTTVALQIIFVFVTYNLFNTIFYTLVCSAYGALPSYATDDSVDRSQMLVYNMLFAAAMQTILASSIMPMVEFFGGVADQMAWVKSILVFGAIGALFLFLTAFFVRERTENKVPPENLLAGMKCAFKNKYWIYSLFIMIGGQIMLVFNLTVSVYYLKDVVGNLGLMGTFVAVSNLPGVVVMMVIPSLLRSFSKQKLVLIGTYMMLVAQILFIFSPTGNVTWLIGTALVRGIGMGFGAGLAGAMVADCIEYGEWKTGTRVQGVLFAANSVGSKIASGLLTSVLGFVLTAVGYDGMKEIQSAATITGINNFFKYIPLFVCIILLIFTYLFDLEKKMPAIQKDLVERRGELRVKE